jgi:hypothetical protein
MNKNELLQLYKKICRRSSDPEVYANTNLWYYVPQSWHADAFMLCNAHLYPRMILNKREILVTNNLHKVRFLEGIDGSLVTAAFLNTYT